MGNNMWKFEESMLKNTPCHVYSFDCTGDISRFEVPKHERLHFYHICLGHEDVPKRSDLDPKKKYGRWVVIGEIMTLFSIQKMLHHRRIDLLKFDIEGFEWPIFESWPELNNPESLEYVLPHQIVTEIHYRTQMHALSVHSSYSFKYETDMIRLAAHLLKLGYATAIRINNPRCKHCTELTLIRYRCH